MRYFSLLFVTLISACASMHDDGLTGFLPIKEGPYEVVADSPDSDWRSVAAENMLLMTLSLAGEERSVVFELLPELAPIHVANTKALVKQGVFDDTQFYRVIDGFVAQGGPMYEQESDHPQLSRGRLSIPAEFTSTESLGEGYLAFDFADNYADETGFYRGFAVGRDQDDNSCWLLHCYGVLAAGRANEPDSGGTELYIINGPAQRYLDRNTSVFGRVIDGMSAIQALKRTQGLKGAIELNSEDNRIKRVVVVSQLPLDRRPHYEVMKTDSDSFRKLLSARKNRNEEWFVYQHNYMDACGVPTPVRIDN